MVYHKEPHYISRNCVQTSAGFLKEMQLLQAKDNSKEQMETLSVETGFVMVLIFMVIILCTNRKPVLTYDIYKVQNS